MYYAGTTRDKSVAGDLCRNVSIPLVDEDKALGK